MDIVPIVRPEIGARHRPAAEPWAELSADEDRVDAQWPALVQFSLVTQTTSAADQFGCHS